MLQVFSCLNYLAGRRATIGISSARCTLDEFTPTRSPSCSCPGCYSGHSRWDTLHSRASRAPTNPDSEFNHVDAVKTNQLPPQALAVSSPGWGFRACSQRPPSQASGTPSRWGGCRCKPRDRKHPGATGPKRHPQNHQRVKGRSPKKGPVRGILPKRRTPPNILWDWNPFE